MFEKEKNENLSDKIGENAGTEPEAFRAQKHKLDVDADNGSLSVCLRTWTPTPCELVLGKIEVISDIFLLRCGNLIISTSFHLSHPGPRHRIRILKA